MNRAKRWVVLVMFLFTMQATQAEETDQFTLPPQDLKDIGPHASSELFTVIEKAVAETNTRIALYARKANHSRFAAYQLKKLRSEEYLADLIYEKTGPGFPKWMPWSEFYKEKIAFQHKETWPWNNVYWLAFSQSPFSFIAPTPTINMYDYYFGTDKLGHFFMQGHTYYRIYSYLLNHGKSSEKAHEAMILYGKLIEQSYLGTLINGVYSNGDLSANYAGWKFYMNLTHSIKIGSQTLPPILKFKNSRWIFAQNLSKDNLLKPYLSDNLNEALNPCHFAFSRGQLKSQIKKRCSAWLSRRNLNESYVRAKLKETSTWHGEDYGHWLPKKSAVTLKLCFENS